MKYAVGMSGGVDSTVAAALLHEEGHEVIGLTMQIWDGSVPIEPSARPSCFGPGEAEEIEEARALASRIGIPHHTVSLATEYRRQVLDYFRAEYLAGRTPNPCIRCNHTMKFGFLRLGARAAGLEFDAFATGHYARLGRNPANGRVTLRRARDPDKDQSYFLSRLSQEQLAGACFPLGETQKEWVRAKARDLGFGELAGRPESQDFVGGDYSRLFDPAETSSGQILDRSGNVLGRHAGIVHYTIGQRKGLGLAGRDGAAYVVAIDAQRNTVIVGDRGELLSGTLLATGMNWISIDGLARPLEAEAQIRQSAPGVAVRLVPIEDRPDAVAAHFAQPQSAVTPGQAVVFYQGEVVLGSGWIERGIRLEKPSGKGNSRCVR